MKLKLKDEREKVKDNYIIIESDLIKAQSDLRKAKSTIAQQEKRLDRLQKENMLYRQMYLKPNGSDKSQQDNLEQLNAEFGEFIKANKPNKLEEGLSKLQDDLD